MHAAPRGTREPRPALLWIHGGGYVGGSARRDDKLCRRFAEQLGIIVAAVDYRLAPEHPFPAGLDDCYAALGSLAQRNDVDERHVRLWSNRSNAYGWRSYLAAPPGSAGVTGLAAPARHDDLSGLPPTWMGVGTFDLFFDEDVRYAERLRASGVRCRLDVVEGAFHGFDVVAPRTPVSRRYFAAQVDALRAGLGGEV